MQVMRRFISTSTSTAQTMPQTTSDPCHYLIASIHESMKTGLAAYVETTRDLLLTYYATQPYRNKIIRTCYVKHLREEEEKWNAIHLQTLTSQRIQFKSESQALKQEDPTRYKITKMRFLYEAEKTCVHQELEAEYGKNQYFGKVVLRTWQIQGHIEGHIEGQTKDPQTKNTPQTPTVMQVDIPKQKKLTRIFCKDRWLQVLLNRSMLQPGDMQLQKKKILDDTEDFDLFRYAASPESEKTTHSRKTPFQTFAEGALKYYEMHATKTSTKKSIATDSAALSQAAALCKLDEKKRERLLRRSLIHCYTSLQKILTGPLTVFYDLLPKNSTRLRVNSGCVLVPQMAYANLQQYSKYILPTFDTYFEPLKKQKIGKISLSPEIFDKESSLIKAANAFFREIKTTHDCLQDFIRLLSIKYLPLENNPEFEKSKECFIKKCFIVSLQVSTHISQIHQKPLNTYFPLRQLSTESSAPASDETVSKVFFTAVTVIQNNFIDFVTILKNVLYAHLEQKPPFEQTALKELFLQAQTQQESKANEEHTRNLSCFREQKTQELASIDPASRIKLLYQELLEIEDELLMQEFEYLKEKEEKGLPPIYGPLHLKIDDGYYVPDRWKQVLVNGLAKDDDSKEVIIRQIDTANDLTLVQENLDREGSHSPLGEFASLVFSHIKEKAKSTSSPKLSDDEQRKIVIADALLQSLAALHLLPPGLLSLKSVALDATTIRSVDIHEKIVFSTAQEKLTQIQQQISQSLDARNKESLNIKKEIISDARNKESLKRKMEIISIVNTYTDGFQKQITSLHQALHSFYDNLHTHIKTTYTKEDFARAQAKKKNVITIPPENAAEPSSSSPHPPNDQGNVVVSLAQLRISSSQSARHSSPGVLRTSGGVNHSLNPPSPSNPRKGILIRTASQNQQLSSLLRSSSSSPRQNALLLDDQRIDSLIKIQGCLDALEPALVLIDKIVTKIT